MGTTSPLLDRIERIRANKERPSKFATLYPTPLRKPAWVERAQAGRLYGDDGQIKAGFPGGEAA